MAVSKSEQWFAERDRERATLDRVAKVVFEVVHQNEALEAEGGIDRAGIKTALAAIRRALDG